MKVLDDRNSVEEFGFPSEEAGDEGAVEGHEKKNELEEWRDTVVVGVEVAWMAAAWTPSSEAEGDLLVSAVEVLQRDSEEDQRSFCQAKAPPQKRRAVIRVESAEAQDCVSAPALTRGMEQKMEAEDEKDMEELSFVPSAVSEPRWALHM